METDHAGVFALLRPYIPKRLQTPIRLCLALLASLSALIAGLKWLWHSQSVKDLTNSPLFWLTLVGVILFLCGTLVGYFLPRPKNKEARTQTPETKKETPTRYRLKFPRGGILWYATMDLFGEKLSLEERCTVCGQILKVKLGNGMIDMWPQCVGCGKRVAGPIDYPKQHGEALLYAKGEWGRDRRGYEPL